MSRNLECESCSHCIDGDGFDFDEAFANPTMICNINGLVVLQGSDRESDYMNCNGSNYNNKHGF